MKTRRFGLMLCLSATTLMWPSFASAQDEEPPSQFEKVKELASLRGFWATGEDDDESGRTFRMSSTWAANRSYLQMQFTATGDEGRAHMGTVTIGWSAADNELVSWAFWPDSQTKGKVTIDGNKVQISAVGMSVDGKKTTADVTMEADDDTLSIKVRNARRGDEDRPDMDVTMKRRERRGRQREGRGE